MNDNLRAASIIHYIVGGLHGLMSCLFLLYIVFGVIMVVVPAGHLASHEEAVAPMAVGGIFVAIGAVFLLLGLTFSGLTIYSGRCIARREKRTFSIVIAGLNCLSFPLGLGLGIFTLILLTKKEAQVLYAGGVLPLVPPPV